MEKSSVRGGGARAGTAPLPLPPPPRLAAAISSSSPASIRALLARTAGNGAADGQSPRSLLSRILQRGGGGEGGGNGAFGCRVRLPRRYGSSGGGGGRKDGAAEQADATPRVKVVERAPELPLETPRSSLGLGPLGMKRPEEEVMSMNVGLGASLVLLLSKSAVELNKMVELRAQMEAMVSEIRQQRKPHVSAAASSSSQESNGSTAIKDSIACATSEDALSNSSRTADHRAVRDSPLSGSGGGAVVVMHQMEAELQAELDRLQKQRAVHGDKRVPPMQGLELPVLQVKTMRSNVSDSPARSCVVDDAAQQGDDAAGEEVDDDDDDCEEGQGDCRSPPHGGVSARALERRLHEVLQKRQQDRIVELESALDAAQRRLQEREREVVWWRDAAKLVSHRRDESRRLR